MSIDTIHINETLAMEWLLETGMFEKSENVVDLLNFSENCSKIYTAMPEISEGNTRKIYFEEDGFRCELAMTSETAIWFLNLYKEHYFPCHEDMAEELAQIELEEMAEKEAKEAADWNEVCSVMQSS